MGDTYQSGSAAMRGLRRLGPALLFGLLVLLLAACTSTGSSATYAPSPTATAGLTNAQTPNPTPQTISTPGAPVGIAGLCSLPASVSAQPPSDIPPYPGAHLLVGSNQNGSGLFGYCSTAAVAGVESFYVAKIPENGWQHLSSTAIGGTDQIMATKGSNTLIITILADSQVSGSTDIIIVVGQTQSGA